jgi:ATP/maltotriose-dependent transcriptional regulator MalT
VEYRERAYATYRRAGATPEAIESAIWLCLMYQSTMGNGAAARGWLARAESLLGVADTSQLGAWLDYCRAIFSTDPLRSRELMEKARTSAHALGDIDLELCALAELGVVLVKLGQLDAGLRHVDEAMAGALGGEHTSHYTVVMTSCSMLNVCDLVGDLDRARQWSGVADGFASTYGCPYLYAECRIVHGRVLIFTGRWQEADTQLREAVAATKQAYRGLHSRTVASLADLRLRQGRTDDARALIESVDAPVETALVAAAIALRCNEPASAVAFAERWLHSEVDAVAPPLHAGGKGASLETASAYSLLVEAHLTAGNVPAAQVAAERLADLAMTSGGASFLSAHAALAQGRVAAADGRSEAASRHFEEALKCFAQLALPLESARARLEFARATTPTQPALAIAEARAALSALDRLGASADADLAAALLRSWGSGGRSVPRSTQVLTRREQEILGLLGDGLSNQEIADRLYISRKTAAHHVSNLLSKLGVRNRVEAAAYVSRLRDNPPLVHR